MTVLSLSTKQKYGTLLGPNSAFMPGSYESIATVSVGSGGTSSADFTSIPSTYTHLQIRYTTYASNGSYLSIQFNGDTGTNYRWHQTNGDGASVNNGDGGADTRIALPRGSSTANTFGVGIIDILNYANTNMNKTTRAIGGRDVNGAGGYVDYTSGVWLSTSAITSIKLYHASLTLPQYCKYALYGIKVS